MSERNNLINMQKCSTFISANHSLCCNWKTNGMKAIFISTGDVCFDCCVTASLKHLLLVFVYYPFVLKEWYYLSLKIPMETDNFIQIWTEILLLICNNNNKNKMDISTNHNGCYFCVGDSHICSQSDILLLKCATTTETVQADFIL